MKYRMYVQGNNPADPKECLVNDGISLEKDFNSLKDFWKIVMWFDEAIEEPLYIGLGAESAIKGMPFEHAIPYSIGWIDSGNRLFIHLTEPSIEELAEQNSWDADEIRAYNKHLAGTQTLTRTRDGYVFYDGIKMIHINRSKHVAPTYWGRYSVVGKKGYGTVFCDMDGVRDFMKSHLAKIAGQQEENKGA